MFGASPVSKYLTFPPSSLPGRCCFMTQEKVRDTTHVHGRQPHGSGLPEQSPDDGGNIAFFPPSIILAGLHVSHVFLL